jgi:hypothetical protein
MSTASEANIATITEMRQRLQEMESTLARMHALLKQMHADSLRSSKDRLAQGNLGMWELMVGHLDKQFNQLKLATLAREDLEARRAAMYKQAMDKADSAAERARASGVGQRVPGTPEQGAPVVTADPARQIPPKPPGPATPPRLKM